MVRSGASGLNQAQAAQADAAILQRLQQLQTKLDGLQAGGPESAGPRAGPQRGTQAAD